MEENMETFLSHSPQETLSFAKDFSLRLNPGDKVGLVGELGAGKTLFAKGILSRCSGLSTDEITSPTFTLIEEYRGKCPFYHVDLYRLEDPREADELPWDDLFSPGSITLIEWPDRLENLLSHCNYEINIIKKGDDLRNIQIEQKGLK